MSQHPIIDNVVAVLSRILNGVEAVATSEVAQVASTILPPLRALTTAVAVDAAMAVHALEAVPYLEAIADELTALGFKPADWDSPVRQSIEEQHKTEG